MHDITSYLHHHTRDEHRLFIWVLVVCALFAGTVSLIVGMHQSVWFDEAYSILLAKHSVSQLVRLTSLDTHPPLFYLLLKFWAYLFGWSELALRLMSVLSMVGALIVGGLLTRKMFGNRIATGTVIVLALSPLLLRYGFEIRMYALASLIGVSATYCLYSVYKSKEATKRNWLIAYALLVVIGIYTLYYLAFLWIAHVAWIVCVAVRHKWRVRALAPYAGAYLGVFVLFLPWLPTFIQQTSNGALAPIGQPLNFEQLSGIASFNVLYQPSYALTVSLTVVLLLFGFAIAWAAVRSRHTLRKSSDELMLLYGYIGMPIIILMIISLSKPMYTERYLSHVAIGLMMLVGVITMVAVGKLARRSQRLWLLSIVYGSLCLGSYNFITTGNFNFQRNEHPTVNQVAASIKDCAAGTELIAADPYVATELSYYLPDCHIYFVSQWPSLGGGYAPFSGSPYQIKSTADIASPLVTYIYYGTPDQVIPSSYTAKNTRTYGVLNVTEYQR